ncbi:MAG: hypothetical protein ACPGOV_16755 [Magnetovibrionaceae bacterium]
MTVSLAKAITVSVGILLCATSAVVAQTAQPSAQPRTLAPRQLAPVQTEAQPEARQRQGVEAGTGVQIQSLDALDVDSVGVLDSSSGGLGATLWRGSNRMVVERLMAGLPAQNQSRAARGLARSVLLTAAPPPEGQGGADMVLLRVRALLTMGDLESAEKLISAVPARAKSKELIREETQLRLLLGQAPEACKLAAEGIGESDAPFWQKVLIICQILAGQEDKAQLGIALMREMGGAEERFLSLAESFAAGAVSPLDSLAEPELLELVILSQGNSPLPEDAVSTDSAVKLALIANHGASDIGLRLEAGERAVALGGMSGVQLAEFYRQPQFDPSEVASPLSRAEELPGPIGRALLYQAAANQSLPAGRAEAVSHALSLAREQGRLPAAARAFVGLIATLQPTATLSWFAPEALQTLLLAGDVQRARAWFSVLRGLALQDGEAAQALAGLLPIARLAGSIEAANWRASELGQWWQGIKREEGARDYAARLFSLFEALGEPVPQGLWVALLDGPAVQARTEPHPAVIRRLLDAQTNARLGETALAGLMALGQAGAEEIGTAGLASVIRAFRAVGLEQHARLLAVEAALSGRPGA